MTPELNNFFTDVWTKVQEQVQNELQWYRDMWNWASDTPSHYIKQFEATRPEDYLPGLNVDGQLEKVLSATTHKIDDKLDEVTSKELGYYEERDAIRDFLQAHERGELNRIDAERFIQERRDEASPLWQKALDFVFPTAEGSPVLAGKALAAGAGAIGRSLSRSAAGRKAVGQPRGETRPTPRSSSIRQRSTGHSQGEVFVGRGKSQAARRTSARQARSLRRTGSSESTPKSTAGQTSLSGRRYTLEPVKARFPTTVPRITLGALVGRAALRGGGGGKGPGLVRKLPSSERPDNNPDGGVTPETKKKRKRKRRDPRTV